MSSGTWGACFDYHPKGQSAMQLALWASRGYPNHTLLHRTHCALPALSSCSSTVKSALRTANHTLTLKVTSLKHFWAALYIETLISVNFLQCSNPKSPSEQNLNCLSFRGMLKNKHMIEFGNLIFCPNLIFACQKHRLKERYNAGTNLTELTLSPMRGYEDVTLVSMCMKHTF